MRSSSIDSRGGDACGDACLPPVTAAQLPPLDAAVRVEVVVVASAAAAAAALVVHGSCLNLQNARRKRKARARAHAARGERQAAPGFAACASTFRRGWGPSPGCPGWRAWAVGHVMSQDPRHAMHRYSVKLKLCRLGDGTTDVSKCRTAQERAPHRRSRGARRCCSYGGVALRAWNRQKVFFSLRVLRKEFHPIVDFAFSLS